MLFMSMKDAENEKLMKYQAKETISSILSEPALTLWSFDLLIHRFDEKGKINDEMKSKLFTFWRKTSMSNTKYLVNFTNIFPLNFRPLRYLVFSENPPNYILLRETHNFRYICRLFEQQFRLVQRLVRREELKMYCLLLADVRLIDGRTPCVKIQGDQGWIY